MTGKHATNFLYGGSLLLHVERVQNREMKWIVEENGGVQKLVNEPGIVKSFTVLEVEGTTIIVNKSANDRIHV